MSTKVTIKDNGSIKIEGDFEVFDIRGDKFDLNGRTTISLCRCAQSSNLPFCDGSHGKCGFQSEVKACQLPPPKKIA